MIRRFEPYIFRNNGSVVQLEEQGSSKASVGGSNPSRITIINNGQQTNWQVASFGMKTLCRFESCLPDKKFSKIERYIPKNGYLCSIKLNIVMCPSGLGTILIRQSTWVRVPPSQLNVFVAQLVLEHSTFNGGVMGSSPIGGTYVLVAQLVEHSAFNGGVKSSNLFGYTTINKPTCNVL